jgi:cysteine-rich repeat protein
MTAIPRPACSPLRPRCRPGWLAATLLGAALGAAAAPTVAKASPATVAFEGVLHSAGGGPAADGAYQLTFAIYADAKAVDPAWTEGPVEIVVVGGRFATALGASKPLPGVALAGLAAPHLGVQVKGEPELPRLPLHGVLYAQAAGALACTGCVGTAQLTFDGDVDLGGNSLKAKNATLTGDLVAATVTAQSFIGDGSKLTGIAQPKGACKAGEAVVGVTAEGALQCAKVEAAVAAGSLGVVSDGLLTNAFVDVFTHGASKLAIPDNTGTEAVALVQVPDLGLAQALSLTLEVENTDLSKVAIALLPPDDKKVGWVLCDPCGKAGEKKLSVTYDATHPPQQGDLKAWQGKNAKGLWTLKINDSAYCIPQAPGNALLCDAKGGTDGWLTSFAMKLHTVSSKKVQATGGLEVGTGLKLPVAVAPPVTCEAKTRGYLYVEDATDAVRICRKTGLWGTFAIYECGNGKLEAGESCDDGNTKAGDGCDALCVKECGNGKLDAGEECDLSDPQNNTNCLSDCKKISYGKLWLESDDYQWFPVHYPHGTYFESKAIATCKAVGLRLWRDESGPKDDPNWAYDWTGIHNLGGHDICYKVNSATSGQQQSHTGTWMLFGKAWSDDLKLHAKASDGQTVTILNHVAHTGSNETQASYCDVRPEANSVTWLTQSNGQPTNARSVVLCAKSKK